MTPHIIKFTQIKVKNQPRKDFSAVDQIAESIKNIGLLQPILVNLDGEHDDEFILIDGEQRLRAMKKLGWFECLAIVRDLGNEAAKEAQLSANLMRSDLSLVERMRGFSMLLQNAPAKYNEKVIANKFGLKEKNVIAMIKTIRKIDPSLDEALSSGQFMDEDINEIALIPNEFQKSVVATAVKNGLQIRDTIFRTTVDVWTDDVFTVEKARAAGKLHYKGYQHWRTFDKEFAKKIQDEFEARTNKKHSEEKKKDEKKTTELTLSEKNKVKKRRETHAKNVEETFDQMKQMLPKFLAFKADQKVITDHIVHRFVFSDIGIDDAKMLLRAFGVEFKVSDMNSSDIKNLLIKKVITPIVTDANMAVNFVEFCTMSVPACTMNDMTGFKKRIQLMRK